jgi:cytochrome bd-type quinol oxidase subunit 1
LEKLAEAYTQTLQAGMVGITLVGLMLALALIIIIYIMLKDNRIREDRRSKESDAQTSFNQSLNQQY